MQGWIKSGRKVSGGHQHRAPTVPRSVARLEEIQRIRRHPEAGRRRASTRNSPRRLRVSGAMTPSDRRGRDRGRHHRRRVRRRRPPAPVDADGTAVTLPEPEDGPIPALPVTPEAAAGSPFPEVTVGRSTATVDSSSSRTNCRLTSHCSCGSGHHIDRSAVGKPPTSSSSLEQHGDEVR